MDKFVNALVHLHQVFLELDCMLQPKIQQNYFYPVIKRVLKLSGHTCTGPLVLRSFHTEMRRLLGVRLRFLLLQGHLLTHHHLTTRKPGHSVTLKLSPEKLCFCYAQGAQGALLNQRQILFSRSIITTTLTSVPCRRRWCWPSSSSPTWPATSSSTSTSRSITISISKPVQHQYV